MLLVYAFLHHLPVAAKPATSAKASSAVKPIDALVAAQSSLLSGLAGFLSAAAPSAAAPSPAAAAAAACTYEVPNRFFGMGPEVLDAWIDSVTPNPDARRRLSGALYSSHVTLLEQLCGTRQPAPPFQQ